MFRYPQLKCDLSDLSVNVGESMITQSSKVRDLGAIFDHLIILMIILLLYVEAHLFILETWAKFGICYRMMHALLLFMHLLVVD